MRKTTYRLLTVLLTAVMMVALSLNVMAAKSNAVTQDGLTAQLITDKDSYNSGESVKASVQMDNHTGREVFCFVQINVPEGVKLASESTAFDVRLEEGESWITPGGVTLSADSLTTAGNVVTGDNMQAGLYVILTALAGCGIAALFVYGKNKKTWLSIILCMVMVAGVAAAAVPAKAADVTGNIGLSCEIQVDDKDATITASVSYVIYEEIEESAVTDIPSEGGSDTPSEGGNEEGGSDTPSEGGSDNDDSTTENEEVELIINGTFEDVRENEIYKWNEVGGAWGTEFLISQDAHSGNAALGIKADGAGTYVVQAVSGVVAGETYTLKAWVKTISLATGGAPYIKSQFFNGTSHVANGEDQLYADIPQGAWTEVTHTFTVPERANTVEILLRVFNGGEVYWDDVTMVGKKLQESEADTGVGIKEPVGDLLIDYNFDDKTVVGNKMETANNGSSDWTEKVKPVTDAEREGTVLQIIDIGNPVTNPWVRFEVPIQPGAEYQMTAMLKTVSAGLATQNQGPVFKAEYYDAEGNHLSAEEDWKYLGSTEGEWKQIAADFGTPNENVVKARIYLRLMGVGEVYWDDVRFYMTEAAPYFTAESGFFYYVDETKGSITVTTNTVAYAFVADNSYELKLAELNEDGTIKEVLASYNTQATERFTWEFDTTLLEEIGKSYYILIDYKDATGAVLASDSEEVIRYNRPSMMNADGHILEKDIDGNYIADSRFHAVLGYHVWPESYEKALEIGVNVVQCPYTPKDLSSMVALLDKAEQAGIKVLVPLYADMKPAAHEDNIEKTIAAIEAVKDKPALLGYMIMDEPFLSRNLEKAAGGDVDVMYEYLKESYKLIREYDTEHIAYVCEVGEPYFAYAGRVADVLTVDPYIGGDQDEIGHKVSDHTASAVAAIQGRKPVWTLVQAFNWNYNSSNWYLPDSNEVRSFLYQALFAGAEGLGYYRLDSFNGSDEDSKDIWEYELINGINCFKEREFEDAVKAFITKEYTTVAQSMDTEASVWYKVFEKKVGEESTYYIVTLNRYDTENTVTIDLSSLDSVAGLYAAADDISGAAALTVTADNTLTVTLSGNQVVRYKLTDTLPDNDEGGSGTGGNEGGSDQEPTSLLLNGDFEAVTTSQGTTSLDNWSIGAGAWGSSVVAEGNTVFALEPNVSAEQPFIKQTILNLTAGETYVLKGSIKKEDLVGTPYTRILFYKGGTSGQSVSQEAYEAHSAENGVWTEFINEFTVPAGADSAEIYLRVLKGSTATSGILYWDNLSVAKKDAAEAVSLLINGDFEASTEAGSNITADGWLAGAGTWGSQLNLKKQNVHEGAYALGLKPDTTHTQPFVKQTILDLTAGNTYALKGNIKKEDLVGTPYTRILFYNGGTSGQSVSQEAYEAHSAENGIWTEFTNEFTVPEGANSAEIYLRVLDGVSGALYWDDLTVELVNDSGEGGDSGDPDEGDTDNTEPTVLNGTFEAVTEISGVDTADDWTSGHATNLLWGTHFNVVKDESTNSNVLQLKSTEDQKQPFVKQTITGLTGGKSYILKVNLKVAYYTSGSWYAVGIIYPGGSTSYKSCQYAVNQWKETEIPLNVPEGADSVEIYLRILENGGETYWDNISITKVE